MKNKNKNTKNPINSSENESQQDSQEGEAHDEEGGGIRYAS